MTHLTPNLDAALSNFHRDPLYPELFRSNNDQNEQNHKNAVTNFANSNHSFLLDSNLNPDIRPDIYSETVADQRDNLLATLGPRTQNNNLARQSSNMEKATTDNNTPKQASETFILRVHILEQGMKKSIRVQRNQSVWKCKKRIIDNLTKSLKHETFNYGLLSPFRTQFLSDHVEIGKVLPNLSVHDVEMKLKIRLISSANSNSNSIPEKQRKHNNIQNRQKFLEYVKNGNLSSLKKEFLDKHFDPNFIADDKLGYSGMTPLTLATYINSETIHETLVILLTNGAIIDFRNRSGHTALHTAVRNHNITAVNILLKYDPELWKALDQIGRPALFYLTPRPSLEEHFGLQRNDLAAGGNQLTRLNSNLRSASFSSGYSNASGPENINNFDEKSIISISQFPIFQESGSVDFDSRSISSVSTNLTTNKKKHKRRSYFSTLTKKHDKSRELNLQNERERLKIQEKEQKFNFRKSIESASKILEFLYRSAEYSNAFFQFQDDRGWTLWHHIAYHNNSELLSKIIQLIESFGGQNNLICTDSENLFFNQANLLTGNTPLHTAAVHDSFEVAKYLIEVMNCKTDVKNLAGKTAFDYCYDSRGTICLNRVGKLIENMIGKFSVYDNQQRDQQNSSNSNDSDINLDSNKENSIPATISSGYNSDPKNEKFNYEREPQPQSHDFSLNQTLKDQSACNDLNGTIKARNESQEEKTYIVVENYRGRTQEDLSLKKGEVVKVTAAPENGTFWEGVIGERSGWFPSRNVVKVDR